MSASFSSFRHKVDYLKRVKFEAFWHFLDTAWTEQAEIWHADASWIPLQLINIGRTLSIFLILTAKS